MDSTRSLISKSLSPCTNSLVTVQRVPITISITVTFIYNSFFQFLSKVQVLVFISILSSLLFLLLFTPLEFFTSVLADGFSQEFEWQQVSSSLQDSSQDSGRS